MEYDMFAVKPVSFLQLKLIYPAFEPKIKKEKDEVFIFDRIRKNWFVLTPEEWVRQHLVNFLIEEKKIPASRISLEKEIMFNGMKRRYDVVIFDASLKPFLVAECKAPYISLEEKTLDQVLRYNKELKAPYYLISNGISEILFSDSGKISWDAVHVI